MSVTSEVIEFNKMVDTAIGSVNVTQSLVQGFDIDDFVTNSVKSIATTLMMFNKVTTVSPTFAANRRIVSIGGVTVGGYQ